MSSIARCHGIPIWGPLALVLPGVDAGLAASIFHFGEVAIKDLKLEMQKNGIPARV